MGFAGDERGQSIQLGAVLLFGFLVLALVGYQTVIVPQQNSDVEFNHYQDVLNDFKEAETAFSNAAASGEQRSQTIKLGTRYPARIIAMNPPPVSGTVSSSLQGNISFPNVSDTIDGDSDEFSVDVCGQNTTNTFEYEPGYNELSDTGTLIFEHRVVYRQFEDGSEVIDHVSPFIQGETISMVVLADPPKSNGVGVNKWTFVPGETGGITLSPSEYGNMTVEFPSKLSRAKWNETLSGNENVLGVGKTGDTVLVDLKNSKDYTIRCTAVGIGEAPTSEPDLQVATGGGSGGGNSINPSGDQSIRLTDISRNASDKDVVILTFNNSGDTVNVYKIRFPFYHAGTDPNEPEQLDIFNESFGEVISNLQIRGDAKKPSSTVTFDGNGSKTRIELEFEESDGSQYTNTDKSHFATIRLQYMDGRAGTYFIDFPVKSKTGSSSGFSSVEATNLSSSSDSDTQLFSFTLSESIADSETVEIDLSGFGGNSPTEIDYRSASTSVAGGGRVRTITNKKLVYEPPSGGLSDGDTVTISVSKIDPGSKSSGVYSVPFKRSDKTSSESDSFTVS